MLVVLADPNGMNRRFLRAAVKGCQAVEVATFDDLLGAIEDLRPALVIVDPLIAPVTTDELLDRVLATEPAPAMLVVSGRSSVLEEARHRGVPAAAKRTLLDLSEIEEVVRRIEASLAASAGEPPVSGLRLAPPEVGIAPFGVEPTVELRQAEAARQLH